MGNRALQHLHIIKIDPYQPHEHKQPLDVIQHGNSLLSPKTKIGTSARLDALLTSFTPIEAVPDMYTWVSQMVESSYYPQSTMTPIPDKVIKTLIAYADNEEDQRRKSANEGYRRRITRILEMISTQICKLECTWQEIAIQDQWKYEDHLKYAHLILLLIDENFITSDYCFCDKLKNAVLRHLSRAAYIVPIYLRPCLTENVPFAKIPFLPSKIQKSVSQHGNKDAAFDIIIKGISPMAKDIRDRIL